MSELLLDTSAYSNYKRNEPGALSAIRSAERIRMSPIVLGELRSGFAGGSRSARNEDELREFLSRVRVEPIVIDEATSVFYAKILDGLKRAGTPIPSNDVWIAASAMQHGLIILTADAHFERIPQVITKLIP
jgi:tRNA(fMet)-specific endonuclease VapC